MSASRLLFLCLAVALPVDAWAYLDPGTGSYLFQLAIAGLFAGMMTLKLYYERIKNWIRARRQPALPVGPDLAESQQSMAGTQDESKPT